MSNGDPDYTPEELNEELENVQIDEIVAEIENQWPLVQQKMGLKKFCLGSFTEKNSQMFHVNLPLPKVCSFFYLPIVSIPLL